MSANDKMAALILAKAPKGGKDDAYDAEQALHQCMEDFAGAVLKTPPDLRGMMHAFRGAFECLESEPHDEAEGEGD